MDARLRGGRLPSLAERLTSARSSRQLTSRSNREWTPIVSVFFVRQIFWRSFPSIVESIHATVRANGEPIFEWVVGAIGPGRVIGD
jgi:hypothetical protein